MKKPTPTLLSIGVDAKTVKGEKKGFLTAVCYLAPVNLAVARVNLCPNASAGCAAACLFTAGRGNYNNVQTGRIRRAKMFIQNNVMFQILLDEELISLRRKAAKLQLTPVVRLNGTSDIAWERVTLNRLTVMERNPDLQFYDYTKSVKRMMDFVSGNLSKNYHLTFSRSETNHAECMQVLQAGGNVAAVVNVRRSQPMPSTLRSIRMVDGDESDLRFLDPAPCIVGLRAKGKARRDTSGFVLQPEH